MIDVTKDTKCDFCGGAFHATTQKSSDGTVIKCAALELKNRKEGPLESDSGPSKVRHSSSDRSRYHKYKSKASKMVAELEALKLSCDQKDEQIKILMQANVASEADSSAGSGLDEDDFPRSSSDGNSNR